MASCNINTLLTDANTNRFATADESLQRALILQLLCNMSVNGAGSLSGAGSPEGSKTANVGATYWDTAGKILWVKDSGTGNTGWYQLVGP